MIIFIIYFFEAEIKYFKFSDYRQISTDNYFYLNRNFLSLKDRTILGYDIDEKILNNIDNGLYTGLNFFNIGLLPGLGFLFKNDSFVFYYGGLFYFDKEIGSINMKCEYEFNRLSEYKRNIIGLNLSVIDTFLLNFSVNSIFFLRNNQYSYAGNLSAYFLIPFKFLNIGGGLNFKFISKGGVEDTYISYFSPVSVFLKIGYNRRKENGKLHLAVCVKDESDNMIECFMKLGEKVYKIRGERRIELIPGRYKLKFYGNDYEEIDTTIVFIENSNLDVILKKKINLSFLTLKIIDKEEMKGIEADIEIIGKKKEFYKSDNNGICKVQLNPGSYIVKISKEDYLTRGIYFDIENNEKIEKTITLQRLK